MSDTTLPALIGRTLRDFSSQVAISVAASAAAAMILAFPEVLSPSAGAPAPAEPAVQTASGAGLPLQQAGKFVQRHGDQAGAASDANGHGLVLPATLMMPLSLAWSAPPRAEPEPASVVRLDRPMATQPVQAARVAAGPVRERARTPNAQPLQIASVLQAAPATVQAEDERPATILGVALPDSVTRAGRALGGVASTVGAAGSWTVSAASNLLPSWGSSAR